MHLKLGPVNIANIQITSVNYEPGNAIVFTIKRQDHIDDTISRGTLILEKEETNLLLQTLKGTTTYG